MYNAADSRLNYRDIHLQWFAEEGEDEVVDEVNDDESDDDDDIEQIKKDLLRLKKESAGKDSKISKLLEEQKKLREAEGKKKERERKKKDYDRMDADELRREVDRIRDEAQEDAQRQIEEAQAKTQEVQYMSNILRAVPKVDGLDPVIASELVNLMTVDKNADEDEIREIIQSFTDRQNSQTKKMTSIFDNNRRIQNRPGRGDVDTTKTPNAREWAKMSESDKKEFAKYATDEQLAKIGSV